MVPSVPIFRVNSGVKTEKSPNARTGSVVSSPMAGLDKPVSTRISLIKGPTAVIAGLRLRLIIRIAIKRSNFRLFSGDMKIRLKMKKECTNNQETEPNRKVWNR